jgi:hypothetical protein
MSEPSVLFVKPGAIKPNDKGRLYKANVIVVEVADPSAVNFVRPSGMTNVEELPYGAVLRAAATAIKGASYSESREKFAIALANAILDEHPARRISK